MTDSAPTRAALLTPSAPGAIAVIALAGPLCDDIAATILRRFKSDGAPTLAERVPVVCRLVDGATLLDDVVVIRVRRDGATWIELHMHGGVRIGQRALQLLERLGAEVVPAGRMPCAWRAANAIEAAIDAALLRASSRRLTRWLLAQRCILPPFLTRRVDWSDDERVAFDDRTAVAARLLAGIHVALIGPPNAGKSTLANRLIGRERIITSAAPGTTRDWVSETALLRGWPVTLTDTAGVREATCAIEVEAIRRGGEQAASADLVVVLLDATSTAEVTEAGYRRVVRGLPADQPRIVAVNKCDTAALDVAGTGERERAIRVVGGERGSAGPLQVSARTGAGVERLEEAMEASLGLDRLDEALPTGV